MNPVKIQSLEELTIKLEDGERIFDIPDHLYNNPYCVGLRRGQLNKFAISPAKLISSEKHKEDDEDSEALRIGRIFHEAVLFPLSYSQNVMTCPVFKGVKGNTKADQLAAFQAQNPDKTLVTLEDQAMLSKMIVSLNRMEEYKKVVSTPNTFREITFYHKIGSSYIRCKTDLITIGDGYATIYDLKSSREYGALSYNFEKQLYDPNSRLYAQDALYTLCVASALKIDKKPDFKFFVIEKEEPYPSAFISIHPDDREWAMDKILCELELYDECKRVDRWPSYPQDEQIVRIPKFIKDRV